MGLQDKRQCLTIKHLVSEYFADQEAAFKCGAVGAGILGIKTEALTPTYKSYLATAVLPELLTADAICAPVVGRVK